jgi:hypothetical protein
MSDVDDGVRGEVGIVISVVERDGGRVRVIFDDVRSEGGSPARHWRETALFTWNEYEEADLSEMSLSSGDFAQIGEAVVARLQAMRKRVK